MTTAEAPIACCAPLAAPALAEDEAAATAQLFKALADPARVRIVNTLATAGEPVCACLEPWAHAEGKSVTTIEGLGDAHPLQQAFMDEVGAQCGICTPGMVLAAVHLLEKKPEPALADIREGLAGNLCRCTGYMQIFQAVTTAARRRVAK